MKLSELVTTHSAVVTTYSGHPISIFQNTQQRYDMARWQNVSIRYHA